MENEYEKITFIITILENFMTLSKKEQKESIKILKKRRKEMANIEDLDIVIKTLESFIKKSYSEQLDIIDEFKLYRLEVIL